ncbi:MAG: UvrD-helicase domain-containing protein [Nitrospiraceae bacterium]|nr:UvrD-helicase domain-containing protein [Nitrospiraceae bacterium]
MVDWSSVLNPAQLEAVFHQTGPLLVVAGPGTGKTRVLSYRIGYLIDTGIARPDQILAITFTNQAAREISGRLSQILEFTGSDNQPRIGTFHGWALGLLRENLGEGARLPIDERDARGICRDAVRDLGLPLVRPQDIYKRISRAKQYYPPRIDEDEELEAVSRAYHALLKKYGLWDYDDIILEALRLFEDEKIRTEFHKDVPFVLIDEFQDVSPAQYALVRAMVKKDGDITIIGDPNQSIYGFRGADPRFMHQFSIDFDGVKAVTLDTAYRCPQAFLDAAQGVARIRDISLKSAKKETPKIEIRSFKDPIAEAKWVARTIEQRVGGLSFDSLNDGTARGIDLKSLSDVAVLFRARALGTQIAKALSSQGIPFQRADNPDPLAQEELRSIWRIWEAVRGRAVAYHLKRMPGNMGLWSNRVQDLRSMSKKKDGPYLLGSIMEILGLDANRPLLRALQHTVERHPEEDSLAVLIRMESDMLDVNIEAVSLLSIHAAKGLEFPVVFLIGCEDGIIPWKEADQEEERRLFYVGLTRASENIYLTHVKCRRLFGQDMDAGPSPFILDIPKDLLVRGQAQRPKRPRRPRQGRLFC